MKKKTKHNHTKKKKTEYRYVYIMLSQTSTYAARLIKMYTREPYAHVSIALDKDLKEMYSFGRKRLHNPLLAGFVAEDIEKGVFAQNPNNRCSIYELKVTSEQYDAIVREIEIFKENKEKYSYNFLGIAGCMVHYPVNLDTRYFCSQFVAYILMRSGVQLFDKNYGLIRPFDFRINPRLKRIYRGRICNYYSVRNIMLEQEQQEEQLLSV